MCPALPLLTPPAADRSRSQLCSGQWERSSTSFHTTIMLKDCPSCCSNLNSHVMIQKQLFVHQCSSTGCLFLEKKARGRPRGPLQQPGTTYGDHRLQFVSSSGRQPTDIAPKMGDPESTIPHPKSQPSPDFPINFW